jgi:hypothetical protein
VEIMAAQIAKRLNIPFGFYADAKGAWRRETIAGFRDNASLVFVVYASEVEEAQGFFSKAKVVHSGNPEWERYFLPADREAVRRSIGARSGDFVVLSPGTKEPVITILLWAAVLEAAFKVESFPKEGSKTIVILTQHPGDQTPPEMYGLLKEYAPALSVTLIGPSKIPSDELVPGVDAVVSNMNSSVAVHAICRRLGAVDFYGPIARERLKRGGAGHLGQHFGTGAVVDIYTGSPHELGIELDKLLENPKKLLEAQERVHPSLRLGGAVSTMKTAIDMVTGSIQY